jgi:regulatory protein
MGTCKITSIEPQKKKRDRYSIFLDGQFWLGVSVDTLHDLSLTADVELTEAEKKSLELEIRTLEMLQKAYHYLGYRDRSEKEMENKLRTTLLLNEKLPREDAEIIIAEVMERLKKRNLVDDEDLANLLVEQAQARKYSRMHARQYLVQKGIKAELANIALEENYSSETEVEIAAKLAVERFAYYQRMGKDEKTAWDKVKQLMGQKGFSWSVIKEATAVAPVEEEEDAI